MHDTLSSAHTLISILCRNTADEDYTEAYHHAVYQHHITWVSLSNAIWPLLLNCFDVHRKSLVTANEDCGLKYLFMMTSSNGNIFRVAGPLCGEFTGHRSQRPATRNFDIFFDLRLDERLSKHSWGWWFETPSHSLWRHCNMQYIP